MRNWLRKLLLRWEASLRRKAPPTPTADHTGVIRALGEQLRDLTVLRDFDRRDYVERCHELMEASQMQGTGPWLSSGVRESLNTPRATTRESAGSLLGIREANAVAAQGAFGDLELALQNVEWRREVNLSWMEFSRWGIQQIILISRLYYIKNPIIRRLINVDAYYVFGRGVEISSVDESTNDAIKDFLKLNESELGQTALSEHQKRTNYDGNLFFIFFPDTQDEGAVPLRTIDATEIQDIVTNPEDTSEEWFYRRTWTERTFDSMQGTTATVGHEAWYPSIGYKAKVDAGRFDRLEAVNGYAVNWDTPILHRKYGSVGKWIFGCPVIYPALDWAKAARRYLEACATLAASHAQIALTISTKGGQQALAGVKQQLSTTVGPNTQVWDEHPTPVNASVFASGPGTTLQAFHSRGQGLDPSECKQFVAMAAICMDVPPTFLGDLDTATFATAQTLDRPTELAFMHKQEAWRELLVQIVLYALNVQLKAPGGRIRAALDDRKIDPRSVQFTEAPRMMTATGLSVYMTEAQRAKAGKQKLATDIEIKVTFPAIREGDIPALINATVEAMTLGNKGGQIVGIDEKEGVRKLFELNGTENGDELVEEMYPSTGPNKYDPNRTIEDAAAIEPPISSRPPFSQGGPQAPGGHPAPAPKVKTPVAGKEALTRLGWAADRIKELVEKKGKP